MSCLRVFVAVVVSFHLVGCSNENAATRKEAGTSDPNTDILHINDARVRKLLGVFSVTDCWAYRGGSTTAASAKKRVHSEIVLSPSLCHIFDIDIPEPCYQITTYAHLNEGEVPTEKYKALSNFWGLGTERTVIETLDIAKNRAEIDSPIVSLEIMDDNTLWMGYDGWLYQFTRKNQIVK